MDHLREISPKKRGPKPASEKERYQKAVSRFLRFYLPVTDSGCWLWTAGVDGEGYGRIFDGKRKRQAHRFSWEYFKGKIPVDKKVLHCCDTPCCVNPDHLFLGTQQDNIADMFRKGRNKSGSCLGEKNGMSKLTAEGVLSIRNSDLSSRELASIFQVGQMHICRVRRGERWKHLTLPIEGENLAGTP